MRDRSPSESTSQDRQYMNRALTLARRGVGLVSPNPAVGAVLVKRRQIIGEGWHRGPGTPHAEINAIRDAESRGFSGAGATLYVTLEPCSTQGRTPPCTEAIIRTKIARVAVAARDPNPCHAGRGFDLLRAQGIRVDPGICESTACALNKAFNHWIVHRSPYVTLKAAMTLDGRIATESGESKWITGPRSRREAMRLRLRHDAILVGSETLLKDDPSLTVRIGREGQRTHPTKRLSRIILDTRARTPLTSRVCQDDQAALTTVVVGKTAAASRVRALKQRVNVMRSASSLIRLEPLLKRLGRNEITSLLVEGGGRVHASFLEAGLAHEVAFFYAPKILGGEKSRPAVGGKGFPKDFPRLEGLRWRPLGDDLLMTGRLRYDHQRS